MAFSYIILRDVPKEEARLDLSIYEIKGGFRGFNLIPAGVHYASVKDGEVHKGFWCYLPPNDAIIKVLDYKSGEFKNDEPENEEHYKGLALSGAMNQVLIPYHPEPLSIWQKLTKHITSDNFPPKIHPKEITIEPDPTAEDFAEQLMNKKSRFELILFDTHNSNIEDFLIEFEFAFLSWFVEGKEEGLERWRHFIQSIYGAGEYGIEKAPNLFIELIEVLITQLNLLSDDFFAPNSFVVSRISYLAEDMIDCGIDGVVEKGKEFAAYLEEKGI